MAGARKNLAHDDETQERNENEEKDDYGICNHGKRASARKSPAFQKEVIGIQKSKCSIFRMGLTFQ